MLNHQGGAGAQVADAANRVNNQVDDTQDAFKDIKDLIPEEAVAPNYQDSEQTSGRNSDWKTESPSDAPSNSGDPPAPETGATDAGNESGSSNKSSSTWGTNPASSGTSNASESDGETDGDDAENSDDKVVEPPPTFNDKARKIQGEKVLTQHQEAMDRIVANWTPQYEAAKHEHQELVTRISDTRDLWPEYRNEQIALIERQGNAKLRDIMKMSMVDDNHAYDRWYKQAINVEMRSAEALSKIEDMNTFIIFYKNQSDFKALTEYDDLDVPLQVGLLLLSLDAFEMETAGLAEAMKNK